jgi:protein-S-isoprenylcysteine O-methyltransferase Ste14
VHFPETALHWLLAGTATSAVIFFAGGLTTYFEHGVRRLWWVRLIHDTGLVLALTHLAGVVFLPPRSDTAATAGIALYCIAIAVFLSAIESAKRTRLQRSFVDAPLPDRLITDGPYRWVRHPFYLGYILGALAAPVANGYPGLGVVSVVMVALTVSAAVREERVWLRSAHAEAYREYRARTGMFLPLIGRG